MKYSKKLLYIFKKSLYVHLKQKINLKNSLEREIISRIDTYNLIIQSINSKSLKLKKEKEKDRTKEMMIKN